MRIYWKTLLSILLVPLLFMACRDSEEYETPEPEMDTAMESEIQEFRTGFENELDELQADLQDFDRSLRESGDSTETGMASDTTASYADVEDLRMEWQRLDQEIQSLEATDESSLDRRRRELDDRLRQLRSDLVTARLMAIKSPDEFRDEAENRLDEMDEQIESINDQVANAAPETDALADVSPEELRRQHTSLTETVQNLDNASEASFEQEKRNVAVAVGRLSSQIDEASDALSRTSAGAVPSEAAF
jgi:septal ring factor EnvC (AmiA/AmiB activator)